MASFELVFRNSVSKDLRVLPKADTTRILKRIRALATDPRPPDCEKLSAQERYRIRQGRYRIVYEIEDHRLVVKIAHRNDVYRQLRRRAVQASVRFTPSRPTDS